MKYARGGKVAAVGKRTETGKWYVKIEIASRKYQTYIGIDKKPSVKVGDVVEKDKEII